MKEIDFSELEDINSLIPNKKKKNKKSGRNAQEDNEQFKVIKYLKEKHPQVLFRVSIDGVRLPIGILMKMKKSGGLQRSLPDIEIFYPNKGYHGLFIEMKKTGRKLKKKNGEWMDYRLEEQAATIEKLNNLGYFATFADGELDAIKIIDNYFDIN
jgi:hypothetical protein